ncbi:hypothetical protein ACX27_00875 [Nostoc piscinale CENA21]|uniref:Uncharacterized protein n=1 Tax=Nostoc piscinale CENA21 TaxID=224013 RepID=A0A0M4SZ89_9NOSO|nr:hypothetical protein ACX27_00875 [Nostoc piscinale CENA21]
MLLAITEFYIYQLQENVTESTDAAGEESLKCVDVFCAASLRVVSNFVLWFPNFCLLLFYT